MVEYLIRVETEEGVFLVHAGYDRGFALQMYETFILRDKGNRDLPHQKFFVEVLAEERDSGVSGPVEVPENNWVRSDFEMPAPKPLDQLLKEAESKVDDAVSELSRPAWTRRKPTNEQD